MESDFRKTKVPLPHPSRAFPNAYLETDEPPHRSYRVRALASVAILGLTYFGLTILALHFEPTGYDPVRQAVSDYAVGTFATAMSLGFFAGGIGLASLGSVLLTPKPKSRTFRLGGVLLLVAGIALFVVGAFPTDVEGAATTMHGTLHSIFSQLVFTCGPIGLLLISSAYGKKWLAVTFLAYASTGAYLALNLALSLGATGLAERFFIGFLLLWWETVAISALRGRLPSQG